MEVRPAMALLNMIKDKIHHCQVEPGMAEDSARYRTAFLFAHVKSAAGQVHESHPQEGREQQKPPRATVKNDPEMRQVGEGKCQAVDMRGVVVAHTHLEAGVNHAPVEQLLSYRTEGHTDDRSDYEIDQKLRLTHPRGIRPGPADVHKPVADSFPEQPHSGQENQGADAGPDEERIHQPQPILHAPYPCKPSSLFRQE